MSKEEKKADLIFDKWKADLKEKDRSRNAVEGNFEELFLSLSQSKVSFEISHVILDKAIKAHYPPTSAVDHTYKRLKPMMNKTKQEFLEEWKELISAAAKRVFYSLYSIDGVDEQEAAKKYGSMSPSEYRKQRKYAESHTLLDWTSIKIEPLSIDDLEIDLKDLEADNE